MKRLTLENFKAKNTTTEQTNKVDQLLSQVLGDCHDDHSSGDQGSETPPVTPGEFPWQ